MPMVEVDENEIKQSRELKATIEKMLAHPEAGVLADRALKMINPNAATPRLDRVNQINEPLTAINKRLDEFEANQKKLSDDREKHEKIARFAAQIETGKAQLRKEGWTEEGIKGVEKIMEERGIVDPLDAAAIFEKAHPPQALAVPSGTGAWNFMEGIQDGDADLKKLIEARGESPSLTDKMARDALNEIRGNSRR